MGLAIPAPTRVARRRCQQGSKPAAPSDPCRSSPHLLVHRVIGRHDRARLFDRQTIEVRVIFQRSYGPAVRAIAHIRRNILLARNLNQPSTLAPAWRVIHLRQMHSRHMHTLCRHRLRRLFWPTQIAREKGNFLHAGKSNVPVRLFFQESSARRLLICANTSTSILRSVDFTPSNSR
jgi:hypothetical protein